MHQREREYSDEVGIKACSNNIPTLKEGATRVELVTSRSAVECSATELYPQMQIVWLSSPYTLDNIEMVTVHAKCKSIRSRDFMMS